MIERNLKERGKGFFFFFLSQQNIRPVLLHLFQALAFLTIITTVAENK